MSGTAKREKIATEKEVPAIGSQSRSRNDNPMQINTVVRCLYGYLTLKDLKSCRSVNHMWNAEAEPLIRKRAKVVLDPSHHYYDKGRMISRCPREFFETFSNLRAALFNAFYLRRGGDYSVSELASFFQKQKSINKLEIGDIRLVDSNGEKVKGFNILSWIENLKVNILTIKVYGGLFHDSTRLLVPVHHLSWITELTLQNCNVVIEDGGPIISPIKLDMSNVNIIKDGIYLKEFLVNNFINFHRTTDIKLGTSPFPPSTTLILDLGEEFEANELILSGKTKIVNWGTSTCSIDRFCVENNPLDGKTIIKIKKLEVLHATVDLVALPRNLEQLTLETVVECSELVSFPNLNVLTLKISNLQTLTHFAKCYNLVDLDIYDTPYTPETKTLDLNWIPKGVKRLKMCGYQQLEGGNIHVDTLVLGDCALDDAKRILSQIKIKILVFTWGREPIDNFIPLMMELKGVILYIGPFFWNDLGKNFQSYDLSTYVDKEHDFYVFQNQLGKAIEEPEFRDNMSLKV